MQDTLKRSDRDADFGKTDQNFKELTGSDVINSLRSSASKTARIPHLGAVWCRYSELCAGSGVAAIHPSFLSREDLNSLIAQLEKEQGASK